MTTWNLTQTQTRRTGIPKPEFNIGRLFARLNGTEGADPALEQQRTHAADGRYSLNEGLDRAQAGG
jgi:hypothetical protein